MADRTTIMRQARTELPANVPLSGRALDPINGYAANVQWKDAQVAGPPTLPKSIVESWRARDDWREIVIAEHPPFSPPIHGENGLAYLARLVSLWPNMATLSPAEAAAATAVIVAYVQSQIGDPVFQYHAWFWKGACTANPSVDLALGVWVSTAFTFKGMGLEDDAVYCPI